MKQTAAYLIETYQDQDRDSLEELSHSWLVNREFWSVEQILDTRSHQDVSIWLLKSAACSELQGIMFVSWIFDISEILFVYVLPKLRRCGGGKQLMDHYLAMAAQREGVQKLFLEVKESNLAAKSFYESYGFKNVSRRYHYYSDGEHALVYEKILDRP